MTKQTEAQQQERMAWVYDTGKGYKIVGYSSAAIAHLDHGTLLVPAAAPQPAQPSKPWVGLSTDEIYDMYNEPRSDAEMVEFARAIEAKLKEKNT